MTVFHLHTPVAFLIFNRPDVTQTVFEAIARARPPKLLVVADGARANKPGEVELVKQTRAIINQVDWPCEVLLEYSDQNLGCKRRVSTGIDWVFKQVPEAIFLEDDCLPDPSFFRFCEEMLVRYRADSRVGMISGDNFQWGASRNEDSYYFSRFVHIWGWASWRDRWQGTYDVGMETWPSLKRDGWLKDLLGQDDEVRFWTAIFDRTHGNQIDTWDFQWVYANWIANRLVVLPNVNLISNIGFGANATHTTVESETANMDVQAMSFPLRHPAFMVRNARFDRATFERLFAPPVLMRIRRKLQRLGVKMTRYG